MRAYLKSSLSTILSISGWALHLIITALFWVDELRRKAATEFYEGSTLSVLLLLSFITVSVFLVSRLTGKFACIGALAIFLTVASNAIFFIRTQELKSGVLISDPNMNQLFEPYSNWLSILQLGLVISTFLIGVAFIVRWKLQNIPHCESEC